MAANISAARMSFPYGMEQFPNMNMTTTESAQEVIVRIRGEAGIDQASQLEDTLSLVGVRRPRLVTLDLSELSSISCLSVGVLVTFSRWLSREDGRVRIAASLQEPVRKALERAGLLVLCEVGERENVAPARSPGHGSALVSHNSALSSHSGRS
jgi:anti-anti-sigma factor